jgi:hypothetical protein
VASEAVPCAFLAGSASSAPHNAERHGKLCGGPHKISWTHPGPSISFGTGAQSQVRVVRITLAPHTSSVVKLVVLTNYLAIGTQGVPMSQRPSFALLQFTSEQRFGVLFPRSYENILLCWMRSGNDPIDFPVEVRPAISYSFPPFASADEIRYLLLGRVDLVLSGF